MAANYINLTEASKLSGQHRERVRRLVNKIVAADDDPRRSLIEPSAEAYREFKQKGTQFEWRVAAELIEQEYGSLEAPETQEAGEGSDPESAATPMEQLLAEKDARINFLERQIDTKDGQIEKLINTDALTKSLVDQKQLVAASKDAIVIKAKQNWLRAILYSDPSKWLLRRRGDNQVVQRGRSYCPRQGVRRCLVTRVLSVHEVVKQLAVAVGAARRGEGGQSPACPLQDAPRAFFVATAELTT